MDNDPFRFEKSSESLFQPMHPEARSHFGLGAERSVGEKLWTSFVMLVMLPPLGLIAMALYGDLVVWDPLWLALARFGFKSGCLFWLLAFVFNWWRPRWLNAIYLASEKRVVWAMYLIGISFAGMLWYYAAVCVWRFVQAN
ncbi:MAG: hypothetical protein EXS05_24425 [Planctomycetaceae bacterium]|nr:hypothetical protein [Planctomycetaceae bacterium]